MRTDPVDDASVLVAGAVGKFDRRGDVDQLARLPHVAGSGTAKRDQRVQAIVRRRLRGVKRRGVKRRQRGARRRRVSLCQWRSRVGLIGPTDGRAVDDVTPSRHATSPTLASGRRCRKDGQRLNGGTSSWSEYGHRPSAHGAQRLRSFAVPRPPSRYDTFANLLSFGQDRRWRAAVVDHIVQAKPRRVLDVACGPAGVTLAIAAACEAQIVGVDLSEAMLRQGKANVSAAGRGDRVKLAIARAEELPFADGTFDAISFSYLMRYVDEPAATIAELARCLARRHHRQLGFSRTPMDAGAAVWWIYTRFVLPIAGRAYRRPRLVPSRPFPRPEHHLSLSAASGRRARRRLAGGRPRQCAGQAMSFGGGLVMSATRRGADTPAAAVSTAATPAFYSRGRGTAEVARLAVDAAPALHRLAPVLRRHRRVARAPDPLRPAGLESARVLPRPRRRRACRSTNCTAALRTGIRDGALTAVAVGVARRRGLSTAGWWAACACCPLSRSADSSRSPTTSSGSAA